MNCHPYNCTLKYNGWNLNRGSDLSGSTQGRPCTSAWNGGVWCPPWLIRSLKAQICSWKCSNASHLAETKNLKCVRWSLRVRMKCFELSVSDLESKSVNWGETHRLEENPSSYGAFLFFWRSERTWEIRRRSSSSSIIMVHFIGVAFYLALLLKGTKVFFALVTWRKFDWYLCGVSARSSFSLIVAHHGDAAKRVRAAPRAATYTRARAEPQPLQKEQFQFSLSGPQKFVCFAKHRRSDSSLLQLFAFATAKCNKT